MLMGFMALPLGGPTNAFYESWADYLQPYPTIFLKTAAIIGHWLAVLFYNLGAAVLDAWHGAWSLADFSSLFTSKQADNMTGFQLTQYIGVFFMIGLIIMSIMMAIQIMQFTMTSGRRGKEWPAGIVTAMIVIWMVPMLITGGTSIAKAMNNKMLGTETQQNVLTKIWRSNTVDLSKLANENFDVHGGNPNQYSPITDDSSNDIVKTTIFTDILDEESQKKMVPDRNKRSVFTKKFGTSSPSDLDKGSFLTKSAAAEVYPRIKSNWFGIIAAELVFSVVGFLAITELLVRFYRLAYYSLTLLVFAFRDMEGKKAMQILHVMEGSIVGIAILPLNVLMFFGFTQWGMNTIGNLNLGWAPYTILIIALMIAGMKGLLGGFALIDDWTGVPTGSGATMTGMVGAAATANGIARGAAAGGKAVGNTAVTAATSLKDKVAQAGEKAAKVREAVNEAGNKTGVMPNKPMPQGLANTDNNTDGSHDNNKLSGITPEAPKTTAEEHVNGTSDQTSASESDKVHGPMSGYGTPQSQSELASNGSSDLQDAPYPGMTSPQSMASRNSDVQGIEQHDTLLPPTAPADSMATRGTGNEGNHPQSDALTVPLPTRAPEMKGASETTQQPTGDAPHTQGIDMPKKMVGTPQAQTTPVMQGNLPQREERGLSQTTPPAPAGNYGGNDTVTANTSTTTNGPDKNTATSGRQPIQQPTPANQATPEKPGVPVQKTGTDAAIERTKQRAARRAHITQSGGKTTHRE